MKTTTRNGYVDFLRGIAMLLVVLGHTMTGVTADSQGSVLFNIVWSLQMPMFILISGYVTRFSRKADSFSGLFKVLGRRTVAYLLPCIIWTLFVRCLILGQFSVDDLKTLLWHTDKGYWFLLTIWTISIVFEISRFISVILIKPKNKAVEILLICLFYGFGFGLLAVLGKSVGLSFFGIKLTLYYMPWYFLGFLYGVFRDRLHSAKHGVQLMNIIAAVCCAVWVFFIVKFDLFELSEGIIDILLRISASLSGCVAVFCLVKALYRPKARACGYVAWCGKNSLQIYVVHYCFLTMVRSAQKLSYFTPHGMLMIAVNFVVTVALTVLCVKLLDINPYLSLVLFGKLRNTEKRDVKNA